MDYKRLRELFEEHAKVVEKLRTEYLVSLAGYALL